MTTTFDIRKIKNCVLEDVNHYDAPDYSDAFISYAELDGQAMTEQELDDLNEDRDTVYELLVADLY